MLLMDMDGDISTIRDATIIGGSNPTYGYFFHVKRGANLLIEGCYIQGMGSRSVTGGLLIETDNATVTESFLTDGRDYCLMLRGTDGAIVSDSLGNRVDLSIAWSSSPAT